MVFVGHRTMKNLGRLWLAYTDSLVPQGGLACTECPLGLNAFLSTRPPSSDYSSYQKESWADIG